MNKNKKENEMQSLSDENMASVSGGVYVDKENKVITPYGPNSRAGLVVNVNGDEYTVFRGTNNKLYFGYYDSDGEECYRSNIPYISDGPLVRIQADLDEGEASYFRNRHSMRSSDNTRLIKKR